jgi:hypothetical protein
MSWEQGVMGSHHLDVHTMLNIATEIPNEGCTQITMETKDITVRLLKKLIGISAMM